MDAKERPLCHLCALQLRTPSECLILRYRDLLMLLNFTAYFTTILVRFNLPPYQRAMFFSRMKIFHPYSAYNIAKIFMLTCYF